MKSGDRQCEGIFLVHHIDEVLSARESERDSFVRGQCVSRRESVEVTEG